MADIMCAKCSEPYDAYGVRNGDMTKREAERFLKGEGCPCCKFGSRCSSCDGSGRDDEGPHDCNICWDRGYVSAWSPTRAINGYKVGELYTGFSPNVRHIRAEVYESSTTLGVRKLPERDGGHMSRDGYVEEWWVQCPEGCAEREGVECLQCEGTGVLGGSSHEDLELEAARSEINASDEDPFDILERRGLA